MDSNNSNDHNKNMLLITNKNNPLRSGVILNNDPGQRQVSLQPNRGSTLVPTNPSANLSKVSHQTANISEGSNQNESNASILHAISGKSKLLMSNITDFSKVYNLGRISADISLNGEQTVEEPCAEAGENHLLHERYEELWKWQAQEQHILLQKQQQQIARLKTGAVGVSTVSNIPSASEPGSSNTQGPSKKAAATIARQNIVTPPPLARPVPNFPSIPSTPTYIRENGNPDLDSDTASVCTRETEDDFDGHFIPLTEVDSQASGFRLYGTDFDRKAVANGKVQGVQDTESLPDVASFKALKTGHKTAVPDQCTPRQPALEPPTMDTNGYTNLLDLPELLQNIPDTVLEQLYELLERGNCVFVAPDGQLVIQAVNQSLANTTVWDSSYADRAVEPADTARGNDLTNDDQITLGTSTADPVSRLDVKYNEDGAMEARDSGGNKPEMWHTHDRPRGAGHNGTNHNTGYDHYESEFSATQVNSEWVGEELNHSTVPVNPENRSYHDERLKMTMKQVVDHPEQFVSTSRYEKYHEDQEYTSDKVKSPNRQRYQFLGSPHQGDMIPGHQTSDMQRYNEYHQQQNGDEMSTDWAQSGAHRRQGPIPTRQPRFKDHGDRAEVGGNALPTWDTVDNEKPYDKQEEMGTNRIKGWEGEEVNRSINDTEESKEDPNEDRPIQRARKTFEELLEEEVKRESIKLEKPVVAEHPTSHPQTSSGKRHFLRRGEGITARFGSNGHPPPAAKSRAVQVEAMKKEASQSKTLSVESGRTRSKATTSQKRVEREPKKETQLIKQMATQRVLEKQNKKVPVSNTENHTIAKVLSRKEQLKAFLKVTPRGHSNEEQNGAQSLTGNQKNNDGRGKSESENRKQETSQKKSNPPRTSHHKENSVPCNQSKEKQVTTNQKPASDPKNLANENREKSANQNEERLSLADQKRNKLPSAIQLQDDFTEKESVHCKESNDVISSVDVSYQKNMIIRKETEQVEEKELEDFEVLEEFAEDNASFLSSVSAVKHVLNNLEQHHQNKRHSSPLKYSRMQLETHVEDDVLDDEDDESNDTIVEIVPQEGPQLGSAVPQTYASLFSTHRVKQPDQTVGTMPQHAAVLKQPDPTVTKFSLPATVLKHSDRVSSMVPPPGTVQKFSPASTSPPTLSTRVIQRKIVSKGHTVTSVRMERNLVSEHESEEDEEMNEVVDNKLRTDDFGDGDVWEEESDADDDWEKEFMKKRLLQNSITTSAVSRSKVYSELTATAQGSPPPTSKLVAQLFPSLKPQKISPAVPQVHGGCPGCGCLCACGPKTNTDEEKRQAHLMTEKRLELEREIEQFKEQNALLQRISKEKEESLAKLKKEIADFEKQRDKELQDLEVMKIEEKRKIRKEKKMLEEHCKVLKEQPNKKEREEIEALKEQLSELQEDLKRRDSRWTATNVRLRDRIETLETENNELKEEIKILEKTRVEQRNQIDGLKASLKSRKTDERAKQEGEILNLPVSSAALPTLSIPTNKIEQLPRGNTRNKPTAKVVTKHSSSQHMPAPPPTAHAVQQRRHEQSDTRLSASGDSGILAAMTHSDTTSQVTDSETILPEDSASNVLTRKRTGPEETLERGSDLSVGPLKNGIALGAYVDKGDGQYDEIQHADGKVEYRYKNGAVETLFANGTRKLISADGRMQVIAYFNGDMKQTLPDKRVVYYYVERQLTHTTYPDGLEVMHFPNGQTEKTYKDGTKEVCFPDQTYLITYPNGVEESSLPDGCTLRVEINGDKVIHFPNGQREVHTTQYRRREYPDGTTKTIHTDGRQETRYSSGRVRIKDKDGNLLLDTHATS